MERGVVRDPLLHLVNLDWEDMWELLNLPTGTPIKRIQVTYSPMMEEWTLWVDLYSQEELDEMRADDGIVV